MAGRPSQRLHRVSHSEEANLLPIMNLMTILIPFLLLSATFIKLTIIDSALPASTQPSDKVSQEVSPTPTPEEKKLTLTVFIREDGFTVGGIGGILDVGNEKEKTEEEKPQTIIEKKPDGTYDYDKLKEILVRIKDAFPGQNTVILLPEPQIKYDDIIQLMDVARTYKKKQPDGSETEELLFPSPVLAGRLI
jgi:biopolymer transport protein ExbD